MASSKEYLEYVLELLREVNGISYKKMMGEYMLYKDEIIFGGVYDNRFLVKNSKSLADMRLREQIPYPGAKPMLLVDSEDPEEIKEIVMTLLNDLRK
ncbi:MAG: transcriptional regulator [Erysipelotrichaceae bacterium]|nr:transcriptional regulator [Erysipelotrichaceae bacterium]